MNDKNIEIKLASILKKEIELEDERTVFSGKEDGTTLEVKIYAQQSVVYFDKSEVFKLETLSISIEMFKLLHSNMLIFFKEESKG